MEQIQLDLAGSFCQPENKPLYNSHITDQFLHELIALVSPQHNLRQQTMFQRKYLPSCVYCFNKFQLSMDRFKTKSKLFKLTCCGGVICNTCRSLDFKRKTKKYLLISSLIILYDFKKSNTTARRSPTVELI